MRVYHSNGYPARHRVAYPVGQNEKGVALIISLVLLVAMTIMGVATLSSTALNEKITSNAQQKSIAFEVAESAIASVWDKSYLVALLITGDDSGEDDPAAVTAPQADTGLTSDFDVSNSSGYKIVDLDGTLTAQYCGEIATVGSDLSADESTPSYVFQLIDVNSIVTIDNTNTSSDHVQRAAATNIATNRTGNCPTR